MHKLTGLADPSVCLSQVHLTGSVRFRNTAVGTAGRHLKGATSNGFWLVQSFMQVKSRGDFSASVQVQLEDRLRQVSVLCSMLRNPALFQNLAFRLICRF
jgi:hypothetical protein